MKYNSAMPQKLQSHYNRIRRILLGVLVLNWAVALAKITYGYVTRCASMTADGFHSLTDGASNIIGIIGIHFACQPVDEDHPYGHKKYETFFSLGIGVLIFLIAFNLLRQAIIRFFNPVTPRIDIFSFGVMIVTLCVNFLVMRYEYKQGRLLQSDILTSDAHHTKSDILTSLSVIIALIVIKLGYPIIDPIATLVICVFITHAGYGIIKGGQAVLCDTAAIINTKEIEEIVLKVDKVKACHKIRTRGRQDDIYVDLHAEVSPDMTMQEAHAISKLIEKSIKERLAGVCDVVVHMEPQE